MAHLGLMIRPQISNAVVISILFATLASGATLLLAGAPATRLAAAAVRNCSLPTLSFPTHGD